MRPAANLSAAPRKDGWQLTRPRQRERRLPAFLCLLACAVGLTPELTCLLLGGDQHRLTQRSGTLGEDSMPEGTAGAGWGSRRVPVEVGLTTTVRHFSADRLMLRILIQLGLRSEELFALRRDDVSGDTLRIDEAIVEGVSIVVKTLASEASVYVPPDLRNEIESWLEEVDPDPRALLFPSPKGHPRGAKIT
jgi:hypothetical protein